MQKQTFYRNNTSQPELVMQFWLVICHFYLSMGLTRLTTDWIYLETFDYFEFKI